MDDWSPQVGNQFELKIKELNRHDRHAVAIKVSGDIFGLVHHEISKIVYFLSSGCFKAVLGCRETKIFEILRGQPTGHFLSYFVKLYLNVKGSKVGVPHCRNGGK